MKQDNVSKEFAGLVGDEWHEIIRAEYPEFECLCGIICRNEPTRDLHIANHTPVYDIELIKARIQARGDWDGFVEWNKEMCGVVIYTGFHDTPLVGESIGLMHEAIAETLTTPALLMQAYIAYRRQADRCDGWCRTSKGPIEDMRSLHGAEMGLNVIDKTCREIIK